MSVYYTMTHIYLKNVGPALVQNREYYRPAAVVYELSFRALVSIGNQTNFSIGHTINIYLLLSIILFNVFKHCSLLTCETIRPIFTSDSDSYPCVV